MKGHHEGHHGHHHLEHGKRHEGKHHRARGGRTEMKVAGNPDVFEEAEDKHGTAKKHGGRAKHKRAAGGKVVAAPKVIGLMTGGAVRPRLDRPGRKRGGSVGGSDKSPLSSAHKGEHPGGSTPNSHDTYGGVRPD
jgi:hypothetical protein